MTTKAIEVRDCNTCLHHVQGSTLDDCPSRCWDCTKTKSLVLWEPIIEEPKKTLRELLEAKIGAVHTDQMTASQYAALHGSDNPMDTQVDGDHYKKLKIQPMEYSMANNLDACQHTVVKYVTRFRDKGGAKDIDKAIHALQMLKQFEYGEPNV